MRIRRSPSGRIHPGMGVFQGLSHPFRGLGGKLRIACQERVKRQ
nr:hypothetical protein [Xylella fastidiosa]